MALDPPYGDRLVPQIVDTRAQNEPNRVVYLTPSGPDVKHGFHEVTAQQFAKAVNKVAWWLESELGKGEGFPTVAYIGPHDLRYVILTLACIKTGYKALLTSPRNGVEAQLSLLKATECNTWISAVDGSSCPREITLERSLKLLTIDSLSNILEDSQTAHYPYDKTFEAAASEPYVVLHSSGSTANPKPIYWKHSTVSTLDATRLLPEWQGYRPWTDIFAKDQRLFSAFPFFHGAGAIMNTLVNAFYETVNVIGPPFASPTLSLIDSLLDNVKIDRWSIIPSIVDEIGDDETVHSKFNKQQVIIASGGPVNYARANKATQNVRIINITGLTEGLFMGILLPDPEDWIYFVWHPWAGFQFREVDPTRFEHFVVRNEQYVAKHQGLLHTFSDVKEMSLKDLYQPHPTKPGLWLYGGRTDDMIVLSSGEKAHPTSIEAIINQHPAIKSSLMIGMAYPQVGVLLELNDPSPRAPDDRQVLLDSVFETIQRANMTVQSFARIHKDYILFSKADKPFARTDKGTVKRQMTWKLYEAEIKDFYNMLQNEDHSNTRAHIDFSSLASIHSSVRDLFLASLPGDVLVGDDENLINVGVDSLLAAGAARALRSAAELQGIDAKRKIKLNVPLFYANPTIASFSEAVYLNTNDVEVNGFAHGKQTRSLPEHMRELRAKYSRDLPASVQHQPDKGSATTGGRKIFMTGTTGYLGSYLLNDLLDNPNVSHVYCANRAADGGKAQQADAAADRGLQTVKEGTTVEYLQVDLAKARFGLESWRYNNLLENVTDIVHLAWPVNLNYGLDVFEPQLAGVRSLIDFCCASGKTVNFMFASTIAMVHHLADLQPVPEIMTERLPEKELAYSASKLVAELVVKDAFEQSGINASICRLGQICGPVNRGEKGMWALEQWVPTIIKSSEDLGVLPTTLGSYDPINWTPVDVHAQVVIDLLNAQWAAAATQPSDGHREIEVYHANNPQTSSWSKAMFPTVHRRFPHLRPILWADWVDALSASQEGSAKKQGGDNMALRLLDFYEKVKWEQEIGYVRPSIDTTKAQQMSLTMREMQAVGPVWTDLWLRQWGW